MRSLSALPALMCSDNDIKCSIASCKSGASQRAALPRRRRPLEDEQVQLRRGQQHRKRRRRRRERRLRRSRPRWCARLTQAPRSRRRACRACEASTAGRCGWPSTWRWAHWRWRAARLARSGRWLTVRKINGLHTLSRPGIEIGLEQ